MNKECINNTEVIKFMTCNSIQDAFDFIPGIINVCIPGIELCIPGIELCIPTIWRRICAEVIDFLLLFLIKFLVTMMAVDYIDLMYVIYLL